MTRWYLIYLVRVLVFAVGIRWEIAASGAVTGFGAAAAFLSVTWPEFWRHAGD